MDGPFSNIPRMKRFVVEGIYQNGVSEQEAHEVFTPIANMESFLKRKGYVSQIELTLKNGNNANSYQAVSPTVAGIKDSRLVRTQWSLVCLDET